VVCSVVVVVEGFTGCTVVSSVVDEVVVVWGRSEAQPESAPRREANRQGSRSFFIILISWTGHQALLMRAGEPMRLSWLSWRVFYQLVKPTVQM
jgi:hypothetical protein